MSDSDPASATDADETTAATGTGDGEEPFSLTDEQRAATATEAHVAVTAGAGTGKTTTLTRRYLKLLGDGVDPREILTITFTNDAAGELRERVRAAVDDELDAAIAGDGRGDGDTGGRADTDRADYDHWRAAADAMGDAYVHTIHESCARLRSEFAVAAGVNPSAETLDESDAGVLARQTVRTSVTEMLDPDDDRHGDLTRLGRLWSRSELETVLVGLLESRPESRAWVDRWRDADAGAHADAAWRALYPVSVAEARARLTDDAVQSALATITDIDPAALGIDPDSDDGAEFVRTVESVCRETDVADGTASGRDWQLALDRLCDRLTTGNGDPYTGRSVHYYRGAKSTWSAHEATQEQLETAGKTLIDRLDPAETPFVGGRHADGDAAPYLRALARVTDRVLSAYDARKRDRTALDFDDLVTDTVSLLREEPAFRAAVCDQFEYVMVDEMQDTDDEQWELIQLLAGADPAALGHPDATPTFDTNLFLVGDEKQSIYRFRGADVTTFGDARATLADANAVDGGDAGSTGAGDAETDHADLELSGNFRTLDGPRAFCNEAFERVFAPAGDERAAFEAAPQALSGERGDDDDSEDSDEPDRPGSVEYLFVPDDDVPGFHGDGFLDDGNALPFLGDTATREAAAVAARLSRLLASPPTVEDPETGDERPARPEDVTVLLRARTRLPAYERALDAVDVPYTVASGTGFWQTPEVRTLVGLLEVLADPTDDTALYGLLRSPVFGLPDDDLAAPTASEGSLWATIRAGERGDSETGDSDEPETAVTDELAAAGDRIADWRERMALGDGGGEPERGVDTPSWGQFLSRVSTETGYLGALAAGERPRQAVANVEQFREQVRDWADGGAVTLAALLTRVRDRRAVETHADQASVPDDADGVRLRTIHSAKGLEFSVVVVPEVGREFVFGSSVDDDGKLYLDRVAADATEATAGDSGAGDGTAGDRDTTAETVPLVGIKAPSPGDGYDHVGTLARRGLRERDRRRERAEQRRLLYVALTRTRDHLLLSGHHSVDDVGGGDDRGGDNGSSDDAPLAGALDDPKPHADARRWRDWLAPLLLGDGSLREPEEDDAAADARAAATADTLRALQADGAVTRSLGDADYTVRVPPAPATDWRERRSDDFGTVEEAVPRRDVAPVDPSPPPVATTATAYAEAVAPEVERSGRGEGSEGDDVVDTDSAFGLAANDRGTAVHELLEHRPPREEWRESARRRATGLGDPTDADVDAILEHADRGLATRERLLERVDPASVHAELPVTARFDAGRIVGEIDLLVVTDERYVVLDYKTDATEGVAVDDLAATHWPQLRVYAAALAEREDGRDVELRLCFTDAAGENGGGVVRRRRYTAAELVAIREEMDRGLPRLRRRL
ncbi:UvrD-helicase domain-containing protein [Halobaculum sp. MBLA0143]|uniref:UvrD-helicase domain-containing protein n=1 Tax=Halobaculum sp. MBLA0143 TaxID=3079933 RepID=UPI003526B50E